MAKKVLSIEVGTQMIKVCEMDYLKKNPKVYNVLSFETPIGAVEDGYIRDKQGFAAALKEQLITARIKTTDIVFSINSTKIANREVIIPSVKDSKIAAILMANITEYFPIDVSDYTIAHTILERFTDSEAKKLKLQVLAVPNALIKNYYSTAKILNYNVENIDYFGNSFYQSVKSQVGSGVNVAVQINEDTTMINVLDNETLLLQRTVPYGVKQVVEAVMDNATIFGKTTEKDAIQFLSSESVLNVEFSDGAHTGATPTIASDAYDRAVKEIRAKEDVTMSLNYLISNISRVLDYFASKFSDKKVNYIYLCGVGSHFQNISLLFTHEIGIETKTIDRIFSVQFDKTVDLNTYNMVDFMTCFGATIAPMNIRSAEGREIAEANIDMRPAFLILGICVVASIALVAYSMIRLSGAKSDQEELQTNINKLNYIRGVYEENTKATTDVEVIAGVVATTESITDELNDVIDELEQHLPSSAVVSTMNVNGSSVSLAVTSDTKLSVAKLLMELKTIDRIENVYIASISETYDENNATKENYSVTFNMVRPPVEEDTTEGTETTDTVEETVAE